MSDERSVEINSEQHIHAIAMSYFVGNVPVTGNTLMRRGKDSMHLALTYTYIDTRQK
jgi:hypothetical protein